MSDEERLPFDRHRLFTKNGKVWIHKCHNKEGEEPYSYIIKVSEAVLKAKPNKNDKTIFHQCAEGQKAHEFTVPREYDYRVPEKGKKEEPQKSAFNWSGLYSASAPRD